MLTFSLFLEGNFIHRNVPIKVAIQQVQTSFTHPLDQSPIHRTLLSSSHHVSSQSVSFQQKQLNLYFSSKN